MNAFDKRKKIVEDYLTLMKIKPTEPVINVLMDCMANHHGYVREPMVEHVHEALDLEHKRLGLGGEA